MLGKKRALMASPITHRRLPYKIHQHSPPRIETTVGLRSCRDRQERFLNDTCCVRLTQLRVPQDISHDAPSQARRVPESEGFCGCTGKFWCNRCHPPRRPDPPRDSRRAFEVAKSKGIAEPKILDHATLAGYWHPTRLARPAATSRLYILFPFATASLYNFTVSAIILSDENFSLSLASPASPIRFAVSGLSSKYSIFALRTFGSPSGTRNPVSPSTTN